MSQWLVMFNLHMHDSMLLALLCKAPQELFVPKHRAKVQQSITIITNLSFTLRRCRWMFKLLTPFNISAFTNVDSFTFYPQNQTFFFLLTTPPPGGSLRSPPSSSPFSGLEPNCRPQLPVCSYWGWSPAPHHAL